MPVTVITRVQVRPRKNSRMSQAVMRDRLAQRSRSGSAGMSARACSATSARAKGSGGVQRARSMSRRVRAPEVSFPQLYASTLIGSSRAPAGRVETGDLSAGHQPGGRAAGPRSGVETQQLIRWGVRHPVDP